MRSQNQEGLAGQRRAKLRHAAGKLRDNRVRHANVPARLFNGLDGLSRASSLAPRLNDTVARRKLP